MSVDPRPAGPDAPETRSAIILHGLVPRSLRHTVASLREQVIAPLESLGRVDVFYHSWMVPEIHNPRGGEHGETLDASEVERWLPEACGGVEPQEDFDKLMDWEELFRNNPMRSCCDGEAAARATLMNFLRALESQERAWRAFEETKSGRYDIVVATRADLKFLGRLDVAALRGTDPESPPCLRVPWFHPWGGVNDRFAAGNEEAVRIWSNRMDFARDWLPGSNGESSEWLLMKWLEKNRVRVGFLDLVFQRVRANGHVAEMDRELRVAGNERADPQEAKAPDVPRERFLILAREAGSMAENLRKVLEPLGKVEVIVDRAFAPPDGCPTSSIPAGHFIHIPDDELAGHEGLMGRTADLPPLTAWSRALAHLARTLEEHETVWFVEDDVAGDAESFAKLVQATRARAPDLAAWDILSKEEDPEWYFWTLAEGWFSDPCRAFQPLCSLSARLVLEILEFRNKNGGFIFHELLFGSLARSQGMSVLDFGRERECKDCFSTFVYRPEVNGVTRGIAHPVKDPHIHASICGIPPAGFPRLGKALFQSRDILPEDYLFLARLCRKHSFTRIVEFGCGDSTRAFLDAGCRIASHEHDIGWLHRSTPLFEGEPGVELIHCPGGTVPERVPFPPDMVFVGGPPCGEGEKMSRLRHCEWALDTCGCFLLYDANRPGEQATLGEMERRGMRVTRIPTRRGLALVVDPARRPEMIPAVCPRGGTGTGWFSETYHAWSVMFHESWAAVKMLETGVFDGTSVALMLDQLFIHPESEVHGIALYEGEEGDRLREAFMEKTGASGHGGRFHLYEGTSCEVLAWMIAGDGFWESFNFIHLAGAETAADLLSDACQAWRLLKPGGILVLDGSGPGLPGIGAFLSVYGERAVTLFEGKRIAVLKRY